MTVVIEMVFRAYLNFKLCVLLKERMIWGAPLSLLGHLFNLVVLLSISYIFICYSSTFKIVLMTNLSLQASHDMYHYFSSLRFF